MQFQNNNIPPNLGKGKHATRKETREANLILYDRPKWVCISKAKGMANLTEKEKMAVFGLCSGSMLLGVHTPCALGEDGAS